jgi:myo-inositol 2-dehydrogenase/D-chiro-inositol 1-dehydrogenase
MGSAATAPVVCAVIGVGMIGREHAKILAALPEFELVACCDTDAAARDGVPDGVAFHTDLEALLDTDGLEAVFVCVPQHLHRAVTEPALRRRLAVFCEKPMAHSLEDADAMTSCAAEHETLLAIGHTLRFDPGYISVRESVAADEIGAIAHMAARWVAPQFEGRIISGRTTVPQEMMIHDIDIMRWIAGPVTRVYAEASPLQVVGPGPDAAVATLTFASGAVAVLDHSWIGPDEAGLRGDHQLSVFGTHGALFVDSRSTPVSVYGRRGIHVPNLTYYSHPVGVPYGALPTEDRCFARCLRSGEEWPVTLADARAALACALAIEQSIATALPVAIEGSR